MLDRSISNEDWSLIIAAEDFIIVIKNFMIARIEMKKLTLFGIGFLALTLGCQSAAQPVIDAKSAEIPIESARNTELARSASGHDHDEESEKDAPRISLSDAKKAFDDGNAIFVDTRAATFFQNEHIEGALNIPSSDFESTYKDLPKDKKIIAYCS